MAVSSKATTCDTKGKLESTPDISVAVADVNGDGGPDLVAANNGANTVTVLLNTTDFSASTVKSVVSVANGSIASGTSTTVKLQAEDQFGNKISTGGLTVTFGLGNGVGQAPSAPSPTTTTAPTPARPPAATPSPPRSAATP
jgi:hypothetical protein